MNWVEGDLGFSDFGRKEAENSVILLAFGDVEDLGDVVGLEVDEVLVALYEGEFGFVVDAFPAEFEVDFCVFDFGEYFLACGLDNFGEANEHCIEVPS